jgi:hypothetical protein
MFGGGPENDHNLLDSDNFRRFRSTTINLILNTDIADDEDGVIFTKSIVTSMSKTLLAIFN